MTKDKEYYKKIFSPWKKSLSHSQKKILLDYSENLYSEINELLLEKDSRLFNKEYDEKIKLIDSALTFKLPEEVKVYRSESRSQDIEKVLIALEVVKEEIDIYPNYVSTSFTSQSALRHLGVLRFSGYYAKSYRFMHLYVSKDIKCGYLDEELSVMKDTENEILLARGCALTIKKFKKKDNFDDVVEIFGKVNPI